MYTDDKVFLALIEKVLAHEGGYVNDPNDAGGETNYGISKRSYPNTDIKNLTKHQACEIYFNDFWIKPKIYLLVNPNPDTGNLNIAYKVFDLGINTGPNRSIKMLQQAYNALNHTIGCDGIIGPQTLGVKDYPYQGVLFGGLINQAANYYYSLNQPRYINGWINRLNSGWLESGRI